MHPLTPETLDKAKALGIEVLPAVHADDPVVLLVTKGYRPLNQGSDKPQPLMVKVVTRRGADHWVPLDTVAVHDTLFEDLK